MALDLRLQARYGLYAVTLVVVILWSLALWRFGEHLRPVAGELVPVFVAGNLLLTTFYFMAALVLFEKAEGSFSALVTTPLRETEYLLSKTSTLCALAVAETLAIGLWLSPPGTWLPMLLASVLLAAVYTLCGFVAVVRYRSITDFLIPSLLYVFAFMAPFLGSAGWVDPHWFLLHPVELALLLMRSAFGLEPAWKSVFAVLALGVWIGGLFRLARRAFERFVSRTVGD